jgi:hypothetical protein
MVTGNAGSIGLRHALAFAADLRRRVLVNKESAKVVAMSLGLDIQQTKGACRLLKSLQYRPSPERLALVVMRDHGLDNEDIAEIFGRSPRWAYLVRENADELRELEPIPWELECLDDGVQPGDPTPDELYKLAAEIRSQRVDGRRRMTDLEFPALSWRGNAFIPFSA